MAALRKIGSFADLTVTSQEDDALRPDEGCSELKAIGRIAYTHARDAKIFGNMPVDDEEKQLGEFTEDGIAIELAAPL